MVIQLVAAELPRGRRKKQNAPQPPIFYAEPVTPSNSFVGTEEYIAPVSDNVFISQNIFSFSIPKKQLQFCFNNGVHG